MIKKETITKEEILLTRMCDFCDETANMLYDSNRCEICNRDVCKNHKVLSPAANSAEYGEYFCLECFEISKPYFERINELESEIEDIFADMQMACKKGN